MAYFMALVLVPPEETNIKQTVGRLIEPYSKWIKVPPWKQYLWPTDISSLAYRHNVPYNDLEQLATKIEDGGLDENGLYYLTTHNPKGMWDSWRVGDQWDGVIQGHRRCGKEHGWEMEPEHRQLRYNTCIVSQLPKFIEFSEIVTPDGVWHSWGIKPELTERSTEYCDWREEVRALMEQHADCIAVCISCHF